MTTTAVIKESIYEDLCTISEVQSIIIWAGNVYHTGRHVAGEVESSISGSIGSKKKELLRLAWAFEI